MKTPHRVALIIVFIFWSLSGALASSLAQDRSPTVVFYEAGFLPADAAAPSEAQLKQMLPGARFVTTEQLTEQLKNPATRLLVLPYGSAFPETSWAAIYGFLQDGGNLLALGGRPFTRAEYRDASGWHLRDYSVQFIRALMIDQYQTTAGSEGMEFHANAEMSLQPHAFAWKQGFSPVIRLSAVDLYNRGGSTGSIDARLDTLAWGLKNGRRLSAPLIQVDHFRNIFEGGRWIFLAADIAPEFYGNAQNDALIGALGQRAIAGSEEFTVRPTMPLYLPGEPIGLEIFWHAAKTGPAAPAVRISMYPDGEERNAAATTVNLTAGQSVVLAAPKSKGLHVIKAELMDGDKVHAIYHSGFWIRDEEFLRRGARLSTNHDYFELDGHPMAVAGTTYMASDVQRLYFEHPNVYVWNQDLEQIHDANLNMIRAGWWTGWDKFCDENGQPYERSLRTIEAYLMTAHKYGLPVQFNFFAFLPDVLGGENAYLDRHAVARQQTLVAAVVARFHDLPYLAWDLINEPSFSKRLWTMRPNGDPVEAAKWNEWLAKRYPDRAALAAAWRVLPGSVAGTIPVPQETEFNTRGMYVGHNSLKTYDYFLFAQESFAGWVAGMRETIRATGSQQLITVGQDEGGFADRLSPAFFGASVDFTTNHSWWQNDAILWDSLVAKQPGQTMLIQETGLQRELNLDETARRTPESEADLLERKIAMSFVQGSGAIEWLWNTNSYMTEGNETPIGSVRTDGTEKPEASIMRGFGAFAKNIQEHLRNPQLPAVAIVTSQAAQFSALSELQVEAQRKAVRAVAYGSHVAPFVIAENQIGKLGAPRLAILPSPQMLSENAWQALLRYVNDGGNLLITGPLDRDEHWRGVPRIANLIPDNSIEPLTFRDATMKFNSRVVALSFDQQKQFWLDTLRFNDGSTIKEITQGKGKIFWAAYPVELAEGTAATTELYSYVLGRVGIKPAYTLATAVPAGVLIYATVLQDSVMYVMVSDSAEDVSVDLRDEKTGVRLNVRLRSQHAALAVIGMQETRVIAKYGF
ncbi:MAG: hypothetical protein ABLQ96_00025 [Candidatus Acidiferrum sp.]